MASSSVSQRQSMTAWYSASRSGPPSGHSPSPRCADQVAFFYLGELIEVAPAAEMFTAPKQRKTQEYITGRFG